VEAALRDKWTAMSNIRLLLAEIRPAADLELEEIDFTDDVEAD
jgi:hypothetical protein